MVVDCKAQRADGRSSAGHPQGEGSALTSEDDDAYQFATSFGRGSNYPLREAQFVSILADRQSEGQLTHLLRVIVVFVSRDACIADIELRRTMLG